MSSTWGRAIRPDGPLRRLKASMARSARAALVVVAVLTAGPAAPPLAAQPSNGAGAAGGAAAPAPADEPPDAAYQYDLDQIREGLSRPPSGIDWAPPGGIPVFRVDIQDRAPGIEAIVGDIRALRRGPWASSPYHQQFLDMVTPPEARASFTNSELLQVLGTGLAGGRRASPARSGITSAVHGAARPARRCARRCST
jgi:hypothetical protein